MSSANFVPSKKLNDLFSILLTWVKLIAELINTYYFILVLVSYKVEGLTHYVSERSQSSLAVSWLPHRVFVQMNNLIKPT